MPLLSICIPAYNNPGYLIRAIDSVLIQTFKDYEIIITDDTPSDILKLIVQERYSNLNFLHYYKNPVQLGSTANWNYAISLANTNLIKLLHHDDWLTDKNSLEELVTPLLIDPKMDFVCCQSHLYDGNRLVRTQKPSNELLKSFKNDISSILLKNFIAPSSTIFRKTELTFDTKLAWLVDADFYAMYVNSEKFFFIPKPLISLNISQGRLTSACEDNLKLLVDENLYLLRKYNHSEQAKKNILKYIRIIIRNFSLYDVDTFKLRSGVGELPLDLEIIIKKMSWGDRIFDFVFRILRNFKRIIWERY